jgi:hypothetical protein
MFDTSNIVVYADDSKAITSSKTKEHAAIDVGKALTKL